jgi:phage host-nuclease inhibitor protein Gam
MDSLREPRSTEQAAVLLEHWADLDAQIAAIEADRKDSIADVNARCDRAETELLRRRDAVNQKLASWWAKAGEKLTEGKRKSIELGGCEIGSVKARATLTIAGEEKDVVAALSALRWAKPFLRIKASLDRVALLKGLDGRHSVALAELGVGRDKGAEQFTLKRVDQNGTLGKNS